MCSPRWIDDDELLRELGSALREAPTDESVIRAGQAAYTWRTVDAELELLTLAAEAELAGQATLYRGPAVPCTLSFQGGQLSIEIEIDENGIVGQLIPPQPGQVTLMTPAGSRETTQADEVGYFSFPSPGPGPLRVAGTVGADRFITEWITA